MSDDSATLLADLTLTTTIQTSTFNLMPTNDTIFNIISNLLNGTNLYAHQIADLIEPEKYSTRGIHIIIWSMTIITYLLAIPIAVKMVRTKAYLNVIDYFSFHLILCAFFAWIPSLILILYHWFQLFTLRFCRLHYVILSTNETVSL
jgi:hypothetical protein